MVGQVKAFIFDRVNKSLKVLDQLQLPTNIEYIDVLDSCQGYGVIKKMNVRGAPCIAAVGCLSIIVEANSTASQFETCDTFLHWLKEKSEFMIESRPTAVNLRKALNKLGDLGLSLKSQVDTSPQLIKRLTDFCIEAIDVGRELNQDLGERGAEKLVNNSDSKYLNILTHCNTGSLATVGYGTALGVIRSLNHHGKLGTAFCTETRPYNQGSRLTAWELVQENIPATLIADSMVAYLMQTHQIDAVIVGADCVAANGDTANKIGTLQIAILAKNFNIPFYVAAPTQTIDLTVKNQDGIKIEQRPPHELRRLGSVVLAPDDIKVWNPCFDVTPADLIEGIITEFGVFPTTKLEASMSTLTDSRQALF